MRKQWLLALVLFLLPSLAFAQSGTVGPTNQIYCNKVATLATGSTGDQQVIAAVTGQLVFICGWHITNTGASGTFAFDYGTGSNCGTGKVAVIPAQNVTSNAPSADHTGTAYYNTIASQAFCVNPSVNTIAGVIFYAQF